MSRADPRTLLAACAILVVCVLPAGCARDPLGGYSFASSFDERIESISVAVFGNETFFPGVESDLTRSLIRTLQRDTPWQVTSTQTAQTRLSGTIRSLDIDRLARDDEAGITQQAAVTITVDFEWIDAATGRTLVQRRGLRVTESFVPDSTEPIDIGLTAAAEEAADAIVAALRSGW
ncbi:MAG: LptE family protein [Planctomycetota bacterium]